MSMLKIFSAIMSLLLFSRVQGFRLRVVNGPRTTGMRNRARFSIQMEEKVNWPVKRVRSEFVDYFKEKHEHTNYKSSPCVPVNDPTLLFANAGMNQFKPIFMGTVEPSSPLSSLARAVNSQKCIRAGGKHNDLDDVGKDTYHHTFFEMLGTWSFGNYFKKEAIDWAYDLLVNRYGLDSDRLYASYFGGDEEMGLPVDTDARDFWLQYLPAERVLPFNRQDNFWEMGDTGPCGPCSEVHYDRIGNRDASALVNADDPDVIEIWNLVFMQFNREVSGELRQLPKKHIDTGMGLERLTSILQDKSSNYDTDAFMPLFEAIEKIIGCPPYSGKLGEEDAKQNFRDTAYRVIADHVRTLSFAIADGAIPSNEGRGYVLRRVLRRAVRYGVQTLGAEPGFFAKLVPVLGQTMGEAFPELIAKQSEIIAVVEEEEAAFSSLLERGMKYFNEIVADMREKDEKVVRGETAFFMYDSLGFPIDLTQIMAEENDVTVDLEGFHAAMSEQKERSRVAMKAKRLAGRDVLSLGAEQTAFLQDTVQVAPTDDSAKYSWDAPHATEIAAIFTTAGGGGGGGSGGGFIQDAIPAGSEVDTVGVVLKSTPFYAEAGGQAPDSGTLTVTLPVASPSSTAAVVVLTVLDVQVYGGYVLHTCVAEDTAAASLVGLQPGLSVTAQVDYPQRRKVAPNHTMTHVLNFALRKVLDDNVDQKGSSVTEDKLRFDFSLNRGVKIDELEAVENAVNDIIKEELEVSSQVVPLAEAMAINGLRAVFGEVYPDPVRVISVGPQVSEMVSNPEEEGWMGYSVEFCGGTHIQNTREAEAFVILEETAVAKGIRRISGVTGEQAKEAIEVATLLEKDVQELKSSLQQPSTANIAELESTATNLRQSLDAAAASQVTKTRLRGSLEGIQKEIVGLKNKELMKMADEEIKKVVEEVNLTTTAGKSTSVITLAVGSDAKAVKRVIESIKSAAPTLSFLCISSDPSASSSSSSVQAPAAVGKLTVFAVVTEEAQAKGLKANEWVSTTLKAAGGRGGGKPGQAQGSVAATTTEVAQTLLHEANQYMSTNAAV